jgi:HlyD family secretion protein
MKTKIILSSFLILAVIISVSYFLLRGKGSTPQYKTARVERGAITATISATGTLTPLTTVLVGSQVSGRIQSLFADFNSEVKQDQIVAQIDPASFKAQLTQAKANLKNAAANLEIARVRVKDTRRSLRRYQTLLAKKVISQDQLDTALTNYEMALAQVKSAEAQVGQAKANNALAETNLRYTTIHSPVDGIVIARHVDIGQTVAASFQTPIFFTIAEDLTKMRLEANVDEADIGRVALGQKGTFYVDAYPGRTFQGTVSQIRNNPKTIQNVVTYDVIMEVDNPDFKLKPGMTATASIITAHKEGILRVPNSALRFQPQSLARGNKNQRRDKEPGMNSSVWALDQYGERVKVPVKRGISDGIFTEIKEGEVKEGQEVIVGGLDKRSGRDKKGRRRHIRLF